MLIERVSRFRFHSTSSPPLFPRHYIVSWRMWPYQMSFRLDCLVHIRWTVGVPTCGDIQDSIPYGERFFCLLHTKCIQTLAKVLVREVGLKLFKPLPIFLSTCNFYSISLFGQRWSQFLIQKKKKKKGKTYSITAWLWVPSWPWPRRRNEQSSRSHHRLGVKCIMVVT